MKNLGPIAVALLILALVGLGISCAVTGGLGLPFGSTSQQEEPGDCDAGDLRESKPDPDCNGLWLGTPTPGSAVRTPAARKTTAPAVKPANPRPTRR